MRKAPKTITVKIELGPVAKMCFVVMPFGSRFDPLYADVIKEAVTQCKLECKRADEIFGANTIMRDVWKGIRSAQVVVADLSGRNPNVLYELGLAHALGKPVIILTQTMEDVPSDLKHQRCVVYDRDHPKWGAILETQLVEAVRTVLKTQDDPAIFPEIVAT